MIDPFDGYTETGDYNGHTIRFRPIIGPARAELFRQMQDSEHAELIAEDALWESVDAYDLIPDPNVAKLLRIVAHIDRQEEDRMDARNLVDGVWLELTNSRLAHRDCEQCKKWWYNEETGQVVRRNGKPLRRIAGTPVPCETAEGCKKGTPDSQKSLSEKNRAAYRHYRRCRRLGFPDDDVVLWHAELIEAVENRFQARRIAQWMKNSNS